MMIADADGAVIAGPVERREEILTPDIDMRQREGSRWILDVSGHYARPDIFDLQVNRTPRTMIRDADPGPATAAAHTRSRANNRARTRRRR